MQHPRPVVAAAAVLAAAAAALLGLVLPMPTWWSLPVFLVVGALLALAAERRRWWVALGFALLLVAWVEAGQAALGAAEHGASVGDLAVGSLGAALGVGGTQLLRAMRARRGVNAGGGAPRSR